MAYKDGWSRAIEIAKGTASTKASECVRQKEVKIG